MLTGAVESIDSQGVEEVPVTARIRRGVLAAGLCVLMACTGCASPSTAFSVDGTPVSQAQVDQVAASCQKAFNQGATTPISLADMRVQSVQWQLGGTIGEVVAKRLSVTFSQDDLLTVINQSPNGPALMRDALCQQTMYNFATAAVLRYQVGAAQFAAQVAKLNIEVNPRYGSFDPSSFISTGNGLTGAGSLSQLAGNS